MDKISELYQLGGIQLVMVAAFIVFMWRLIKYFVSEIKDAKEAQLEFIKNFGEQRENILRMAAEERREDHKHFNEALSAYCQEITKALEKLTDRLEDQEEAFRAFIIQFKK